MIHLEIIQDQRFFFSWEVLYFSYLSNKIKFKTEDLKTKIINLEEKHKIYKNWKLIILNWINISSKKKDRINKILEKY